MSSLFTPITLRGLTLENRIMVSPMCQYSALEGCMSDWHYAHLMNLSLSGASLLCFEMTDVEPIGRITSGCVGLYDDSTERSIRRAVELCRKHGASKLGIQLGHAGRKGSTAMPWDARKSVPPLAGGWQPVAPSALAWGEGDIVPRELSREEIRAVIERFAESATRAARIGFDTLELHGAHGYLLHQFLSPLSNRRNDEYGGTPENRMRFALEVLEAVRAAWPADRPLGIRVSATDWTEGGWDLEQTVRLCRELKALGCDFIDCSSGGLLRNQTVPFAPGYNVPFSERIRREVGIATISVGMITEPGQAEQIVASGKADLVALARGFLWNPRWGLHAAKELGGPIKLPLQYQRALPLARAAAAGAHPGVR